MHPRRLLTVALAAVLVTGGLAACQADPAVAAYVDDVRITESEVDEVVAELDETLRADTERGLADMRESLDEQASTSDDFDQADADAEYAQREQEHTEQLEQQLDQQRDRVVEMRILTEAATAYAEEEGVEPATPQPERHAEEVGLPAEHSYVSVVADYFAVMGPLQGTVESTAPSEEDQREVYDHLVEEGATEVGFDEARQVLTEERIGQAVAMRDLFVEMLDRADVELNPRYQLEYEVPVQLGQAGQSWLGVPIGDPAVTDG